MVPAKELPCTRRKGRSGKTWVLGTEGLMMRRGRSFLGGGRMAGGLGLPLVCQSGERYSDGCSSRDCKVAILRVVLFVILDSQVMVLAGPRHLSLREIAAAGF